MYQSDVRLVQSQIIIGAVFIERASALRESACIFERNGIPVEFYNFGDCFIGAERSDRTGCLLIDATSSSKRHACLSLLRTLQSAAYRLASIVVVDRSDISLAARAIRTGAYDVLDDMVEHPYLLSRVQEALDALRPAPPILETPRSFGWKVDKDAAHAALTTLTTRQRQILDRIVSGQPNKIIAADLGINLRTAENHRAAIMKKLGASSISSLIQIALAAS